MDNTGPTTKKPRKISVDREFLNTVCAVAEKAVREAKEARLVAMEANALAQKIDKELDDAEAEANALCALPQIAPGIPGTRVVNMQIKIATPLNDALHQQALGMFQRELLVLLERHKVGRLEGVYVDNRFPVAQ